MTLVTGYLGATVAPIGVLVLLVAVLLVRPGGHLLAAGGAAAHDPACCPPCSGRIPRTLARSRRGCTVLAIGGTFLLDPYRNFQLATIAAYFCATAGPHPPRRR